MCVGLWEWEMSDPDTTVIRFVLVQSGIHNGTIYGEFVRHYVRNELNLAESIDIRFKTVEKGDAFVSSLGPSLRELETTVPPLGKPKKFLIKLCGTRTLLVSVTISSEPCDLVFDIDHLTMKYSNSACFQSGDSDCSSSELIQKIKNKECCIINLDCNHDSYLIKKMKDDGWKIAGERADEQQERNDAVAKFLKALWLKGGSVHGEYVWRIGVNTPDGLPNDDYPCPKLTLGVYIPEEIELPSLQPLFAVGVQADDIYSSSLNINCLTMGGKNSIEYSAYFNQSTAFILSCIKEKIVVTFVEPDQEEVRRMTAEGWTIYSRIN